ncbi:MAG: hypothetical protein Q9166_001795 [cf. Caloplaca sp. 2 TL-2023]
MTPGSIYLPPLPQTPLPSVEYSKKSRLSRIPEGIFGHPVLVTSVNPWTLKASFLTITSSGGKPFQNLCPELQQCGVPIWPNSADGCNRCMTYLVNDWALPKASYINTRRQYTVPCSILKPLFDQLNGHQFTMRDTSFAYVQTVFDSSNPGRSRSQSPASSRSWSPSSNDSDSQGGVLLSPWNALITPCGLKRPRIQYSTADLLSLRPKSTHMAELTKRLKTEDFDLLPRSQKHPAPDRESKSRNTSRCTACASPIRQSPPAWRTSSTPLVSTHQHQHLVDDRKFDLYNVTAPVFIPQGKRFVDTRDLKSNLPTLQTSAPLAPTPAQPQTSDHGTMINSRSSSVLWSSLLSLPPPALPYSFNVHKTITSPCVEQKIVTVQQYNTNRECSITTYLVTTYLDMTLEMICLKRTLHVIASGKTYSSTPYDCRRYGNSRPVIVGHATLGNPTTPPPPVPSKSSQARASIFDYNATALSTYLDASTGTTTDSHGANLNITPLDTTTPSMYRSTTNEKMINDSKTPPTTDTTRSELTTIDTSMTNTTATPDSKIDTTKSLRSRTLIIATQLNTRLKAFAANARTLCSEIKGLGSMS